MLVCLVADSAAITILLRWTDGVVVYELSSAKCDTSNYVNEISLHYIDSKNVLTLLSLYGKNSRIGTTAIYNTVYGTCEVHPIHTVLYSYNYFFSVCTCSVGACINMG